MKLLTQRLTFEIPADDAREFAGLPAKTRDQVRWYLQVMRAVAASAGGRVKTCQEIADAAEVHFNTIYQRWKRYANTADWRELIDRRHTSEFWKRDESKIIDLPAEFIAEWKTLVEDNDRAAKPAHLHLIRRWKQWRAGDLTKAIAGYPRCPEPAAGARKRTTSSIPGRSIRSKDGKNLAWLPMSFASPAMPMTGDRSKTCLPWRSTSGT